MAWETGVHIYIKLVTCVDNRINCEQIEVNQSQDFPGVCRIPTRNHQKYSDTKGKKNYRFLTCPYNPRICPLVIKQVE